MTNKQKRQDLINIIMTLTDEECKQLIRVFGLIESLSDKQARRAMQLLKGGMSTNDLSALIENGGIPA